MANNGGKINFQVGFSVDKSGLSEMQSLFQQIANRAAEPGNKMNTGLQQAAKTASTLDNILTKTFNTDLGSLNVTKFNQELSKSGLSLKDVKAQLSQAGNQGVTAFNRLSQAILGTNQQIRQSSKALDSMFTTFKNTIRYGISSSVFNNMANSIQRAFDYSKQLDTSLNDIRIVTDKSAESMADFAKQANEAAKGMGASTLDYTNAALIYYQQGLDDAEVAARAETTIKAANVTGQTGEEVSEQLTAVWNGYKVTAEETELYVDKLAAVAATTAADLEELSVGMSKVASAANAMGVDFDDLNAQIATIVSVTRQAPESVGTALKTIYARLGDLKVDGVDEFGVSLGTVSEQMVQMGIQILDQNGDLRDMSSVIAEVAEKWNGWTQAQRQAAAVAMAGKRQYNNLIALFDNWDMYTEALNTSTEAVGTLQHQQDIYMESTTAKLKTLKAAWQGLYDDAINEDEVNAGIEALTNLVEVFDNFIDSFGGGIKSIAGFGAIISSIFNKQISESIINANQRVQVFKQNLELAQTSNLIRQEGAATAGDDARSQAIEANTQKQIEYSQKIYEARLGLNQEQANTLIGYQKEIGALEEEIVYTKELTERTELKYLTDIEISDILNGDIIKLEKINSEYAEIEDKANEQLQTTLTAQKVAGQELATKHQLKTAINNIKKAIAGYGEEEKQALLNNIEHVKSKQELKILLDQLVDKEKRNVEAIKEEELAADRVVEAREKIVNLQEKQSNIKQQADEMLDAANNATTLAQKITTVTSTLGNLAMAWSSINALMDTWNDSSLSVGDKMLQTIMTLGMTIPIVISNFQKLNEVLLVSKAIREKNIALAAIEEEARLAIVGIGTKEAAMEEIKNIAQTHGVTLTNEETASLYLQITARKADTASIGAETVAQQLLNTVRSMDPVMWVVAGLTALVAVTALVVKAYDSYVKKQIESNNATIEKSNAIQDEVNANEELYNSYEKLINQYNKNEVGKEALVDVTDKLAEKYKIEGAHLAKLTGDYSRFTVAVRKAREEELKSAQRASQYEVGAAGRNLYRLGQQTKQASYVGSNYRVNLGGNRSSTNQLIGTDIDVQKVLARNVTSLGQGNLNTVSNVNANNPKEIIQQYDEIQQAIQEMEATISRADLETSLIYKNAVAYIDEMADAVEEYRTALEELDNYNVQLIFNKYNLEGINSFKEYNDTVESIRQELLKQYDGDSEKVKELLDTYLSGIDNEFIAIGLGLDELKDELKLTDEEFKKLQSWSDEDKKLLLSGKVDFDGLSTADDLHKLVENLQNQVNQEDLEVVVSLRGKITSDKKLTKKQIEEAAGEESLLAQQYDLALSDFDNQSQLKQVDTLNKIVEEKININSKYIQNAKETAEDEKEILEKQNEAWTKELEELQQKKANAGREGYGVVFTDEDAARMEELENKTLSASNKLKDLSDIIENGLSIDEIEDINFDNLISGLGSVVSVAEVLKDLAEDMGENWTVAADSVKSFGENFPELLAEQENYNILQDGSLQLTEQGKEQLQELTNQRIKDLQIQSEAYSLELQKQIDIQQATADFYTQQADALEDYLNGEADAKETEAKMEQNAADYRTKLMQVIGDNDEELNRVLQENLDLTNQKAEGEIEDIFNYWCSVGEAAEAAALAYEDKHFNKPTFKGGTNTGKGTQTSTYTAKSVDTADYTFETLDQDQLEQVIKKYRERAEEASNRVAELTGERAALEAQTQAAIHSLENIQQGKAGKDSKSKSSSSKDKDKELKKLDEEFDRYWEIHKALDQIDRDLKRMDKDQENLYGKELIRSLKQENELLANQSQLYEQLYAAQEQEAAELRGTLANSGVAFDASGAVLNYAEATAAALAEYNKAIQDYNNGLLDDAALKIHEQKFEQFKKDLERYDTLFYTEMQDTLDKIDDLRRQTLANNLKAWEVEIQLKLDFKELERDWNDFIKEVTSDFQKVFKDLRVEAKNMLKDAATYVGSEGTINTIIGAVHDVTGEIDKLMGGGSSDMFESVSQAQEKLKELNDQLLDSGKALHDLWMEAWDNYLEGIDQVSDAFDDLLDRYERINDELEFQSKLIELLYGEEAYKLMSKYYEGIEKNTAAQIQSVKAQVDMWKELFDASGATMDNQLNWNEDQKKYYEQWTEAQEKLNDLVLEYIELLKKDYLNTISDVMQELEKYVTGSNLDSINTQWERIAANADKYYDSVEGAYYIQTLANKIDQSIADADGLKAQQKLMALREKEIDYLREKETLTEYDIKAAEMRYQIALKEMALEDAQNNKTGMKLTRNEQGNWSYQYVADETDVATRQQELLDAYNNLYQLASDAYEANLEALQELQEKYLESAKAIYEDDTLTEEERQAKLLELREWYLEQYKLLSEENQLYRNDLASSGAALLLEIYEQDQEAYESMTEHERELVDALINANIDDYMELEDRLKDNYQEIGDKAKEVMSETRADWTSGAQTIADLWNKDGGWSVKTQVVKAYDAIEEANRKYKEAVDWCAAAVERNFGEEGIVGAIQAAEYETDALRDKTVELVVTSIPYLQELQANVIEIGNAWKSVQNEIMAAIGLIDEYLRKVGEANEAQARAAEIAYQEATKTTPSNSSKTKTSDSSGNKTSYDYETVYGSGAGQIVRVYESGTSNAVGEMPMNVAQDRYGNLKKHTPVHMATGGYTGAWGDSGKLAVLHEKELVLNADDTKNFLSAVNTIRTLSSSVGGSIQDAVLKAVANTALSLGSIKANGTMGNIANNNSSTDNVFNITAEFPNANSVDDIREAILSLPNLASQYANSTLK